MHNGTWHLEWVGDSPAGRKVGANQALCWTAIRMAIARGCHTFSFGRTAASNEGLRTYKRHWGTKERDLSVLVWGEDGSKVEVEPGGAARKHMQRVLQSTSPVLYRTLSDWCYRHLG